MDVTSKNGLNEHNPNSARIFDEARRVVCNERSERHGDTRTSFEAMAIMWQEYLRASNVHRHGVPTGWMVRIDATDIAQMMSILKKMRFAFGDHKNPENFVDDVGYTGIAAELADIFAPNPSAVSMDEIERAIRNDP